VCRGEHNADEQIFWLRPPGKRQRDEEKHQKGSAGCRLLYDGSLGGHSAIFLYFAQNSVFG
jgi:hypothetical protein